MKLDYWIHRLDCCRWACLQLHEFSSRVSHQSHVFVFAFRRSSMSVHLFMLLPGIRASLLLTPTAVAVVGHSPAFVWLTSARYLKNRCSRVTKLGIQMFHDESMETHMFGGLRGQRSRVQHENRAGVDLCTLVGAGFF